MMMGHGLDTFLKLFILKIFPAFRKVIRKNSVLNSVYSLTGFNHIYFIFVIIHTVIIIVFAKALESRYPVS